MVNGMYHICELLVSNSNSEKFPDFGISPISTRRRINQPGFIKELVDNSYQQPVKMNSIVTNAKT